MRAMRCAGWPRRSGTTKPPPKDKAIAKKMRSSSSNMNARRFRCIGLEYFDNIDLKFHIKRTTGMMQLWGHCECQFQFCGSVQSLFK